MTRTHNGQFALEACDVSVDFPGRGGVLRAVSLQVRRGEIVVIAGPNGCGKSTLLKVFASLLKPTHGAIKLEGHALQRHTPVQLAQRLTTLPQGASVPAGMTVEELVTLGRYPYQRWWQPSSGADMAIVADAITTAGLTALASRSVALLSGGERQRAWIAMALAQQTPILLLDEPTTYLDMAHQLEVLDLIERLNRQQGKTFVIVLHDLTQAARIADHLVLMRDGALLAQGTPLEVLTPENVARAFDVEADILLDSRNRLTCLPVQVHRFQAAAVSYQQASGGATFGRDRDGEANVPDLP